MKILLIDQFPPEQAIHFYVDEKVWKYGNKKPKDRAKLSLQDYLIIKMEKFVSLYEADRPYIRNLFQKKIDSIDVKNLTFPFDNYDAKDLIARIEKRLQSCFPALTYQKSDEGYEWKLANGENGIALDWRLEQSLWGRKFSAPHISIDTLKAHDSLKNQGIAVAIVRLFVEELQIKPNPLTLIDVVAFSGLSAYFGQANGAYVWAKLGFDFQKEIGEKPPCPEMKKRFFSYLNNNSELIFDDFLKLIAEKNDLSKYPEEELKSLVVNLINKTKEQLLTIQHPWDVANMIIDDYPIGKYLMTLPVGFSGIIYPNLPHSPGMGQYTRRLQELAAKGYA